MILKPNIVYLVCISAIISNFYITYLNIKYNNFYKKPPETINENAIVIKEGIEKEYSYTYIIKIVDGKYKNKKFVLSTNKKNILQYGDLININGEYIIPTESRNYKGFNYKEYLKSKKIYGTIKANEKIKIIENKKLNIFLIKSNELRNIIIKKAKDLLPSTTSSLLIGILLGDKDDITEDIIEDFKISNLSHMLSVSGAHTSYIILGISYILSKTPKKYAKIITILVLGIFLFITNFTASVTRACLMATFAIGAKLLYRKSDTITNIALSLLIILIINPFSILEIGLQLSYLGTLGIVLFNKNIDKMLSKMKVNKKIIQLLAVTFSAQIFIMPIMAYRFNTISLTFFISNLLAGPILGIVIILGFIAIFVSIISFKLAKLLAIILNIFLELLTLIAFILFLFITLAIFIYSWLKYACFDIIIFLIFNFSITSTSPLQWSLSK